MLDIISQIGDPVSLIVTIIFFLIFIVFGPRIMTTQAVLKLEREVYVLEDIANKSKNLVIHKISKKPDKKLKESVSGFMNFFAISPVGTDPYGIIKKLDHVVKRSDRRLLYFTNEIAPSYSHIEKMNIKGALTGAITTHTIAKIVRHYLELVKKYNLYQLAMVVQMQIPLIMRISKASMGATHAFIDGVPIGDGIGPLVTASLMKGRINVFEKEEFAVSKTRMEGKDVWVCKASGPGASTGYPGKFLIKFLKRNKIDRIITIDAALKLEGEKTATIAEGVGVAMGGIGVDRYEIEEIAVKKNIPLDAIAIKVSDEDALKPMKKVIFDSVPRVQKVLTRNIKRGKRREKILVMGVGNTCGVPNSYKGLARTKESLRKHLKKTEKKKKKRI